MCASDGTNVQIIYSKWVGSGSVLQIGNSSENVIQLEHVSEIPGRPLPTTRQSGLAAMVVALILLLATAGIVLFTPGLIAPSLDSYERTTVVLGDEDHEVEVYVADTVRTRYVGLSEFDSLGPGEGMLFVHDSVDERTYTMRGMDFGLDIIFIDDQGNITEIHHAPEPTIGTGLFQRYSGTGKYILELSQGFATESGISIDDSVTIHEQFEDNDWEQS